MISWMRLNGFIIKEFYQIIRDPSSMIIAFFLPILMIFLFAFGVSLDMKNIKIGLVVEEKSDAAQSLAAAFQATSYFSTTTHFDRQSFKEDLVSGQIKGLIVIPQDFSKKIKDNKASPIQIIADGSETNTASFVQNYAEGIGNDWLQKWKREHGIDSKGNIRASPRVWFNPEIKSRNVILPGSIAIVLALIGTLLTALVVSREWERGSMEAILATPIRMKELVLGKLIPYFILGMGSMIISFSFTVFVFKVPFIGSVWVLVLSTALFLSAALSQGLLISILAKNQFVASQAAINAAFLPAYMLSGFLYEIQTMPLPLRMITYLFAPRYYVSIIQTISLAGNVWKRILPDMLGMLIISIVFLYFIVKNTKKSLE